MEGLFSTGIGSDPARPLSEWRVIRPDLRRNARSDVRQGDYFVNRDWFRVAENFAGVVKTNQQCREQKSMHGVA
jgi:hypothetical protein